MAYEPREKAKADLKLINKVERQSLALHEKGRWNIGTLKQLRRENRTDDEWRCQTLVKVRGVLEQFPTPEQLCSVRVSVLGRMMAD